MFAAVVHARLELLQRVARGPVKGPSALAAHEALEIATLGGARMVVRDGQLATLELPRHLQRHNRLAAAPRVWKPQRPRFGSALWRS